MTPLNTWVILVTLIVVIIAAAFAEVHSWEMWENDKKKKAKFLSFHMLRGVTHCFYVFLGFFLVMLLALRSADLY